MPAHLIKQKLDAKLLSSLLSEFNYDIFSEYLVLMKKVL